MIKIIVNNTEVTLIFNTSMRRTDFAKKNSLSDATASILFARCHEQFRIQSFLSISESDILKVKESCVLKSGNYRKRIVVTADGGLLKAEDTHLLDEHAAKVAARAAKQAERVAMWKAKRLLELNQIEKDQNAVQEANELSPIAEILNA